MTISLRGLRAAGALLAVVSVLASLAVVSDKVSPARAAATAFELQQVMGKGDQLQLVVSDAGAAATETRAKRRVGVIVRYEDRQVFDLDFAHRTYSVQTVADAVSALKTERGLIAKIQLETPTRDGSHAPAIHFPTLTALTLTATIAGLTAHAFEMHQEGVKTQVRLWFADDLPAPPATIQKLAAGSLPSPLASKRVLLRTETRIGKTWVTGLDTVSSRQVDVTPETFTPPENLKRMPPPKTKAPRSIPAFPLRGVGPVSAAPDVFALYWNGPFASAFTTAINGLLSSMVGGGPTPSTYWAGLGQYGVGRGRFIGSSPTRYPMPAVVGDWDFFDVEGMVSTSYFTTAVPKIWWRVGRDPIIAIMIPAAAVVPGSWVGYHMVDLSLAMFLPWPVSLAAHPEMPWFIVKSSPITSAPDSTTTRNMSHELVETASDPLPLSANTDYTKSPPWIGGEIADICSVGAPLPPSSTIFKFGFSLSLYWSNSARACVG
jgi:hypothetical protein